MPDGRKGAAVGIVRCVVAAGVAWQVGEGVVGRTVAYRKERSEVAS